MRILKAGTKHVVPELERWASHRPRDNERIQLGLKRVLQLYNPRSITWNAVHVAGTNGKGTVCFHVSNMLRSQGLKVGRFTSPHLIDRWDCININGRPVEEDLFKNVEKYYQRIDRQESIGASPFEILTATAFDLFKMHDVDVGVIEVGVGGLEDATNILPQEVKLCSVITQIGLDHQKLLGDTIDKIAAQKAGIIKPNVPCVFDTNSPPRAVEAIHSAAADPIATPRRWRPEHLIRNRKTLSDVKSPDGHSYLWPLGSESNLRHRLGARRWQGPFGTSTIPNGVATLVALAATASQIALHRLRKPFVSQEDLAAAAAGYQWPGRLQSVSLRPLIERSNPALLDGAHNVDSAKRLGDFLAWQFPARLKDQPRRQVTWVLAASAGKDTRAMLAKIVKPYDNVITTEFGPVDGMPWVEPVKAGDLLTQAKDVKGDSAGSSPSLSLALPDVREALEKAVSISKEAPLVISGSLYLASDVLRLLRSTGGGIGEWYYKWEKPIKFEELDQPDQ